MRQLLYSMLVTQGDQEAQKVCTYLLTYIHTYIHTVLYILTYIRTGIHTHIHCVLCLVHFRMQALMHSVYLGHFHELRSVHASSMLWCLPSLVWSPTSPDSSGHLLPHDACWWGIPRADITHHLPGLPEECQQGHCRQTALTGEGQQ